MQDHMLKVLTSASNKDVCWTTSACLRLSTNFDFDMAFFKVLSDASMREEERKRPGTGRSDEIQRIG